MVAGALHAAAFVTAPLGAARPVRTPVSGCAHSVGCRPPGQLQRRALSNSTPEDIARPPTWRETLKGAFFWANTNHWDQVPKSWYLTMMFVFFKLVGTIGGYRGRANFARQSGLKPLLGRRAKAASVVDATTERYAELFPGLAARLAGEPGAGTRQAPALAVVLPTFVRDGADLEEFRATLEALWQQTRQPDAVLVVDDASPFELAPALEGWGDPERLACVRMTQNTGPAGARTVGMRLLRRWAAGRRVVANFTDSDAMPDKHWCEAMLGAQKVFPGLIAGPTVSRNNSSTGRFHDHFGSLNGRWTWDDLPGVLLYGCTCNFSADLTALGNLEFDPVFSRPGFEDIELCWRARQERKVLVRYCEGALVKHEYDRGAVGLYKQFWKYGNTEPIMAWMHPKFSFQGSRTVTLGFQDPRMAALLNSIPPDAGPAAAVAIKKLERLFSPDGFLDAKDAEKQGTA